MLTVTSHQGNHKILLHNSYDSYNEIMTVIEDVEDLELSYFSGGKAVQPLWKTVW